MPSRLFKALFPASDKPNRATESLPLATCVVLLEVARGDEEFTEEERQHILAVLRQRFELDEDEAHELLRDAASASEQSSDLWRFTHSINQNYTQEEKIALMEEVWRLVFSDGHLQGHEDHLVHKLQHLLNLNHPQLIEAKLKVMAELNVRR